MSPTARPPVLVDKIDKMLMQLTTNHVSERAPSSSRRVVSGNRLLLLLLMQVQARSSFIRGVPQRGRQVFVVVCTCSTRARPSAPCARRACASSSAAPTRRDRRGYAHHRIGLLRQNWSERPARIHPHIIKGCAGISGVVLQ
jgi:hypothetical protein